IPPNLWLPPWLSGSCWDARGVNFEAENERKNRRGHMREGSNSQKGRSDDFAETRASESSGRPISLIFREIVSHISEIIRAEVRLARTEVLEDVTFVVKASVFLLIGIVFGL